MHADTQTEEDSGPNTCGEEWCTLQVHPLTCIRHRSTAEKIQKEREKVLLGKWRTMQTTGWNSTWRRMTQTPTRYSKKHGTRRGHNDSQTTEAEQKDSTVHKNRQRSKVHLGIGRHTHTAHRHSTHQCTILRTA